MEENRTEQIEILNRIYENYDYCEKIVNLLIENFTILEINDHIKKINEKN